jgi:hypothetical protein
MLVSIFCSLIANSFAQEGNDNEEVEAPKEENTATEVQEKTEEKQSPPEKKVETTPKPNTVGIPLISSGIDSQIALIRTSAAAKKDIEELNPVTIIDIAGNHPAILLAQIGEEAPTLSDVSGCSGAVMSNSRLKKLTQTADNDLAYYELEKAQERLDSAVDGLVCLQDTIEVDVVQRLYFLQGILQHSLENPQEATKAFSLAIRFKPDLQWDDNFAPDAKPLFVEAKKSFSQAKEIPLEIIPKDATPNIWVNGVALISGAEHLLYEGENIIQVVGSTIQTHKIMVDGSVDKLQLVVPSTMPITANTWVSDDTQREELDFVLSNVLPQESELFVHNSGEVWTTMIGSTEWVQLEVPKRVENRANAKAISGKVLFWSGIGTMAAGLGYSGYFYLQGLESANQADQTGLFSEYETYRTSHSTEKVKYQIGWIVAGSGLGVGALGYKLSF